MSTKHVRNTERWVLASVEHQNIKALTEALDIDYILAKILLARNIGNGDINAIRQFLTPPDSLATDFLQVTTPFHLNRAVDRIKSAIENKELIFVNGDPDADGISGTCILVYGLRYLGANVEYRFPVRSREGHGLQVRIIEEAKQRGCRLILTTDCGSKDIVSAKYAKDQGIDVIVTDHHILGKKLPDVYALVNPHMVEERTYFKSLAGAGVAYKTMLALFHTLGRKIPQPIDEYMLAVATLGTLSDRMSMLNPMNRILVNKGVQALTKTRFEGLRAIKRVCQVDDNYIRPRNLSRTIIPRLNAPGRIGDPEKGIPDSSMVVDMLLIGTGREAAIEAEEIAKKFSDVIELDAKSKYQGSEQKEELSHNALSSATSVDDVNEKRKYLTNKIEEEIDSLVESQVDIERDRVIIVQGKNWNSGVIGIDTDRLKERFLAPAIILTKYDGHDYVRGSVRSIPNIDMYALIDRVGDRFEDKFNRPLFQMEVESTLGKRQVNAFGGHAQACGFSLHTNDVEEFVALVRDEASRIPDDDFHYHYDIIDKMPISHLGPKFLNKLDELSPYGQQFEFPIFYLQGCLLREGKPFGNKYQQDMRKPHVAFRVVEKVRKKRKFPPKEFDAVGFGLWEKYCVLRSNLDPLKRYDVIFTIERDSRPSRGRHQNKKNDRIRLNVLDIRESGDNVDSFMIPSTEDEW